MGKPTPHLHGGYKTDELAVIIADGWAGYGFTAETRATWEAAGIDEPSVAAELRAAGIDPERERDFLARHADDLHDGDLSIAAFLRLR